MWLTSIRIRLRPVSILQPVIPRPLVLCSAANTDTDAISPFEAMSPFPFINPVSFGFYSQTVTLPLRPVALVGVPTGPGVDSYHLEAVVPGARELALPFGSGADAVAVGFAPLPASAVSSAVIELEAPSTHSSPQKNAQKVKLSVSVTWLKISAPSAWLRLHLTWNLAAGFPQRSTWFLLSLFWGFLSVSMKLRGALHTLCSPLLFSPDYSTAYWIRRLH